jgi:hypothetical protein
MRQKWMGKRSGECCYHFGGMDVKRSGRVLLPFQRKLPSLSSRQKKIYPADTDSGFL